ncbi:MAG: transcription termination/antitermination protein NusA, partial [Lachnospiraceae bacterium]|nr:transcription termination/antitermination protein NusA [Lachnospiraceae bacterium]
MSEIIAALNELEKEKNISKEVLMEAIEKSLVLACEKDFGKDAIVEVSMDRKTGDITAFQKKLVVETVENDITEISLTQAQAMDSKNQLGDYVKFEIKSKEFGRIAAQNARNVIVQAIKEGERFALYQKFVVKEKDIITGVVQRFVGNNINVALDDKTDTMLTEKEQVPGEEYKIGDRIKLYVVSVTLNETNEKEQKE